MFQKLMSLLRKPVPVISQPAPEEPSAKDVHPYYQHRNQLPRREPPRDALPRTVPQVVAEVNDYVWLAHPERTEALTLRPDTLYMITEIQQDKIKIRNVKTQKDLKKLYPADLFRKAKPKL